MPTTNLDVDDDTQIDTLDPEARIVEIKRGTRAKPRGEVGEIDVVVDVVTGQADFVPVNEAVADADRNVLPQTEGKF